MVWCLLQFRRRLAMSKRHNTILPPQNIHRINPLQPIETTLCLRTEAGTDWSDLARKNNLVVTSQVHNNSVTTVCYRKIVILPSCLFRSHTVSVHTLPVHTCVQEVLSVPDLTKPGPSWQWTTLWFVNVSEASAFRIASLLWIKKCYK